MTNRVNSQGSHSFKHREEEDLRRCDTRKPNLLNGREVLRTAKYCHSRYFLTHRELPNIREVFRKRRHLISVSYWVFKNLPDIWEVLWNGLGFELGYLSGVGKLTEHL